MFNRIAFSSVSPSQWKDLAQNISYRSGFSGEVSNPNASPPEETSKPFTLSYDYTKKSFGDFANHRVVAPVPWFGIEGTGSDNKKPDEPVVLGAPGELVFRRGK